MQITFRLLIFFYSMLEWFPACVNFLSHAKSGSSMLFISHVQIISRLLKVFIPCWNFSQRAQLLYRILKFFIAYPNYYQLLKFFIAYAQYFSPAEILYRM